MSSLGAILVKHAAALGGVVGKVEQAGAQALAKKPAMSVLQGGLGKTRPPPLPAAATRAVHPDAAQLMPLGLERTGGGMARQSPALQHMSAPPTSQHGGGIELEKLRGRDVPHARMQEPGMETMMNRIPQMAKRPLPPGAVPHPSGSGVLHSDGLWTGGKKKLATISLRSFSNELCKISRLYA
jgi:hypothetical protein